MAKTIVREEQTSLLNVLSGRVRFWKPLGKHLAPVATIPAGAFLFHCAKLFAPSGFLSGRDLRSRLR